MDVLWKVMLLRIELLLQDEDSRLAAAKKRAQDLYRKEASDITFREEAKFEQLREQIARLERVNRELDARVDKAGEDKMRLLDTLKEREAESRLLREDLAAVTAKLQTALVKLNEASAVVQVAPSEQRRQYRHSRTFIELSKDIEVLQRQQTIPQFSALPETESVVDEEEEEAPQPKPIKPIIGGLTQKEGKSLGTPTYSEASLLSSQVLYRAHPSLPFDQPSMLKIRRTRDSGN